MFFLLDNTVQGCKWDTPSELIPDPSFLSIKLTHHYPILPQPTPSPEYEATILCFDKAFTYFSLIIHKLFLSFFSVTPNFSLGFLFCSLELLCFPCKVMQ